MGVGGSASESVPQDAVPYQGPPPMGPMGQMGRAPQPSAPYPPQFGPQGGPMPGPAPDPQAGPQNDPMSGSQPRPPWTGGAAPCAPGPQPWQQGPGPDAPMVPPPGWNQAGPVGMPMAGGRPNWFVTVGRVLKATWRGNPSNAIDLATPTFWMWAALAQAGFVGFAYANLLWRLGTTDGIVDHSSLLELFGRVGVVGALNNSTVLNFNFGVWILAFLLAFVFTLAAFAVRSGELYFVQELRGVQKPFSVMANLYAVSTISVTVVVVFVGLVWLLPSAFLAGAGMYLLLIFGGMTIFLAELMMYVGINRSGQFSKSPMVAHVLCSGVYVLVIVLAMVCLTALWMSE